VLVRQIDFRDGGVYALPDGRQLIASERARCFKLYDALAWKYEGPPLYEIERPSSMGGDGTTVAAALLTCIGRPTQWRVADLTETGQIALRKTVSD
jgi:hypothetical protein